jgi:hypothetical protein
MADDKLFEEYATIVENTAKLSDRRQTVSDLFLGVNSLFLASAGFVAVTSHLQTWWPVVICGAITVITFIINTIWLQLIKRYRTLINLRIRYLEGLESALQAQGTFGTISIDSEDSKKKTTVSRGVFLIEKDSTLYRKGAKVGFFKLESNLVITFRLAYVVLTIAVAILTYLVINHYLPALNIPVSPGG